MLTGSVAPDSALSYSRQMADGGEAARRFVPVARADEVRERPVRVVVAAEPWVVGRMRGRLFAARDRCPHRGAPLSAGDIDDGCLVCPYHGWRFDPDGVATAIPALGAAAPVPPRARLETAEVVERDGLVWIALPGCTPPAAEEGGLRLWANDDPGLRRGWHPVCRSGEVLPASGVQVELLGERWTVERTGGGAPVVAGAFAAADHAGHVWIAPERPVADLVPLPELDEPGWHHVAMRRREGRYGVGLLLDNQLDAGHFAFVHRATFGSPAAAPIPPYEVARDGAGFEAVLRVPISARNNVHDPARQLAQHRTMTYRYRAPAMLFLRLDYEEMGGSTAILFCFTPLDATRSRMDIDLWFRHPEGFSEQQLAERLAFEERVVAEDLRLQDAFDFVELPLTLTAEVHTRADRSSVTMRRIMLELLGSR